MGVHSLACTDQLTSVSLQLGLPPIPPTTQLCNVCLLPGTPSEYTKNILPDATNREPRPSVPSEYRTTTDSLYFFPRSGQPKLLGFASTGGAPFFVRLYRQTPEGTGRDCVSTAAFALRDVIHPNKLLEIEADSAHRPPLLDVGRMFSTPSERAQTNTHTRLITFAFCSLGLERMWIRFGRRFGFPPNLPPCSEPNPECAFGKNHSKCDFDKRLIFRTQHEEEEANANVKKVNVSCSQPGARNGTELVIAVVDTPSSRPRSRSSPKARGMFGGSVGADKQTAIGVKVLEGESGHHIPTLPAETSGAIPWYKSITFFCSAEWP